MLLLGHIAFPVCTDVLLQNDLKNAGQEAGPQERWFYFRFCFSACLI